MAEAGGKPAEAAGWASLSSVGRLWVWRGGGHPVQPEPEASFEVLHFRLEVPRASSLGITQGEVFWSHSGLCRDVTWKMGHPSC